MLPSWKLSLVFFSFKISLDHQEHFQPAFLKYTNYVDTCCEEKCLVPRRRGQALDLPLKRLIADNLHTLAFVTYHNLQRTQSKCKTEKIHNLPSSEALTLLTLTAKLMLQKAIILCLRYGLFNFYICGKK